MPYDIALYSIGNATSAVGFNNWKVCISYDISPVWNPHLLPNTKVLVIRPYSAEWAIGKKEQYKSSSLSILILRLNSAKQTIILWVNLTPLGSAVDPEV